MSESYKIQRAINILATVALMLFSFGEWRPQGWQPMAIDFDAVGEAINFGALSSTGNLSQKTICAWANLDAYGYSGTTSYIASQFENNARGWGFFFFHQAGQPASLLNALIFYERWSGEYGEWTVGGVVTTGTLIHVCVSYDRGSVANDPSFYVNGVLKTANFAEILTPSGAVADASADDFVIGNVSNDGTGSYPLAMNGYLSDVRVYDRILTAAEVAEIYSSRCIGSNDRGLVFNPPLLGAAAGTDDGDTLAATDYVYDRINGAVGTPTGSPTFLADTVLSVCP